MKHHHKTLIFTLIFALILPLGAFSQDAQGFYPARVKDVSDRVYEKATYTLLDEARESIAVSMYIVNPEKGNSVSLLMEDLVEALERGVTVDLYLNTKYRTDKPEDLFSSEPFLRLIEAGANLYPIDSNRLHHDKLIIVDERYIIEGSHNWSISALKANSESSSLIDSPELAKIKLARLKELPLESVKQARLERIRNFQEMAALPDGSTIDLSKDLLENKKYFPAMVKNRSNRAFNIYFILLAKNAAQLSLREAEGDAASSMPIILNDLADDLNIPSDWPQTDRRRQVIKAMNKLQDRYKLIEVDFNHGKEAEVTLKAIPGDTFPVDIALFRSDYLNSTDMSPKFIDLVDALLKEEGTVLMDHTKTEMSKRFHVWRGTIRKEK